MKVTENCIGLIKDSESFRNKAYQDTGGVWTIGYGSTRPEGKPVVEHQLCTEIEATRWLMDEVNQSCIPYIKDCVKVVLNQNQIDALADFIYNLGGPQFESSTLLKKLNKGDYLGAADEFKNWNKGRVDGELKVLPGLVTRREREAKLFLKT